MNKDDEEFLKLLHAVEQSGEDCPEDLIKLANSPFERAVCVEIFKFYKEFQSWKAKTSTDTKWSRLITLAIFGSVVVGILLQVIGK
jgi:hypothetical protein